MMDEKEKSFRNRYVTKKKGPNKGRRVHTPDGGRGYRADLDRLFDKGEVSDKLKPVVAGLSASGEGAERQQLIREARLAESPKDFNALMSEIATKHNFPDDQNLMIRALDHPDEEIVRSALDTLIDMDGKRPLGRRQVLKARLETLRHVSTNIEILDLVEMLCARL